VALLGFLIVFPLVVAAVLFAVRNDAVRDAIVVASAVVIGVASVALVALNLGAPGVFFEFSS